MHLLFQKVSGITHDVIGAAIEVHKEKGPGLLESIYEWCLSKELEIRDHRVDNQQQVVVQWKDFLREFSLRYDILVDQCLLVEVKASRRDCEKVLPIHNAQILSYMKLFEIPLGLIINFNSLKLTDGVSRLILPGANQN